MSLVHVKGFEQLDKFLQELPAKVEKNVLRGGLRAGARVVQAVAAGNIRTDSGELAASLKVSTRARGGEVKATVYTKVFYARWVEYGTRPHRIEPKNRRALALGGGFVGAVDHPGARPHPFLRPALDTQAAAAVVAVGEYIKQRLASKHGLDTADIAIEAEDER